MMAFSGLLAEGTGNVSFFGRLHRFRFRRAVFVAQMSSPVAAACSSTNTITSIPQLQKIGNPSAMPPMPLSGNYCLGKPIQANGATIAPIGTSTAPFTGTFDGQGYEISGLTVSGTGIYVGLFAYLGGSGKISNLGLTNLKVMTAPSGGSGYDVGGLAGRNLGTITDCYTTGSVSGTAGNNVSGLNGVAVGGLVGWNFGTITQSYSTASVTSPTTAVVELGGLAGGNSGTISWSHASGPVNWQNTAGSSGSLEIGGLVGQLGDSKYGSTGTIANSYATGMVTSTGSATLAGGLVGAMENSSTITQSYATGSVNAGVGSWAGGLVGLLYSGTISQSFATGSAVAYGDAGGLVGQMNAGTISQSYATGAATTTSSYNVGGLVARSYGGTISQSYATGRVVAAAGGLAGGLLSENGENNVMITNSYWDIWSTGQPTGFYGIGETTAQLKSGLPIGFDPTVWSIIPTVYYPYLQWQIRLSQLTTAFNTAPYGTLKPLENDAGVLIENETCLAVVYTMIALAAGDVTATVRDFWIDGTGANSGPLSPPIALSPSQPYETNKGTKINGKTTILFDSSISSHLNNGLALIGGTINTGSAGHQELHWMLGVGTVTLNGKNFVVANDPWTGTKVAIDLGSTNPTTKGKVTYIMDPNPGRTQFNLLTAVVNKALSQEINADYQTLPIASNGKTSYSALTSFTAQGFVLVSGS
jgi:The GLUG motif